MGSKSDGDYKMRSHDLAMASTVHTLERKHGSLNPLAKALEHSTGCVLLCLSVYFCVLLRCG